MNEQDLASVRGSLVRAHESLDGVRMEVPVAAVLNRARSHKRRRLAVSGSAFTAVAVAAGLLVSGLLPGGATSSGTAQAQTVAYVVQRVEHALASEHMVFDGQTTSTYGPSQTWQYGQQNQFMEYTGQQCGHAAPNATCTHQGGSELFLAQGTARVHGQLVSAYVTYYNKRYTLSKLQAPPASACSETGALSTAGPPVPTAHWSAFIKATLKCGAASATGSVRINGAPTTKITGKLVSYAVPGYAKTVHGTTAQAQWVMYVNSRTYLPMRICGTLKILGARPTTATSVTNVTWLPPTKANVARSLVVIPPGFRH